MGRNERLPTPAGRGRHRTRPWRPERPPLCWGSREPPPRLASILAGRSGYADVGPSTPAGRLARHRQRTHLPVRARLDNWAGSSGPSTDTEVRHVGRADHGRARLGRSALASARSDPDAAQPVKLFTSARAALGGATPWAVRPCTLPPTGTRLGIACDLPLRAARDPARVLNASTPYCVRRTDAE